MRRRNIDVLGSLLRDLDITVSTRWRSALDMILSSSRYKADLDLQKLETLDMLNVYDDYSRQLEQEHDEESRRHRIDHIRRARKARDGFRALLSEFQAKGELTRKSMWKDMYPTIRGDERYHELLGLPGSNPMDLWMDAVDDLTEEAERTVEKVEKALSREDKHVTQETTWEQFEEMIKSVGLDHQIEEKLRKDGYEMVSLRC